MPTTENIILVRLLAILCFVDNNYSDQDASEKFNDSPQTIERNVETRSQFEENVALHRDFRNLTIG